METKLLPCPFCGGEVLPPEEGDALYSVEHKEECVLFDKWHGHVSVLSKHELEEWNTRYERTCKVRGEWRAISQTQEARDRVCECGHKFGVDRRDHFPFKLEWLCKLPNYCSNCGVRVKEG